MVGTIDQKDINQFWTIYPHLPSDIQKAIFSTENANIILKLTEEYGLENQPTSIKLAGIVGDVLLGLSKLEDIKPLLEKTYSLPKELAEKLDNDLQDLIFNPLRENLKKLSYRQSSRPGQLRDVYGKLVE